MEHKGLVDELRDIVVLYNNPAWDEMDPIVKGLSMCKEITEAACVVLKSVPLDDSNREETLDSLEQAANDLFEEYVIPLDTGLNPMLESVIKSWFKTMIRPILEDILDRLNPGETV